MRPHVYAGFVLSLVVVAVIVCSGCTTSSETTGDLPNSQESATKYADDTIKGFVETYISYIDNGEYEKAADLDALSHYYSPPSSPNSPPVFSFEPLPESYKKQKIARAKEAYGSSGEGITFNSVDITSVEKLDNGKYSELNGYTVYDVHYRADVTQTGGNSGTTPMRMFIVVLDGELRAVYNIEDLMGATGSH